MNIDKAKEILGEEYGFIADDAHRVIRELNLPGDAAILDVGTGTGKMAITLAVNGYSVLTGEPESDDSEYAKQDWRGNAEKVNVDHMIEFQAFDARDMPFEHHRFHAIFFVGSYHHIDTGDRKIVFRECIRTAKSDGIICFWNLMKMQ